MGNILKTRIQQLVDVHKSEAENKKLMKGELAVELTDASGSALDYPLIKVGVDDKITSYDELKYVNKLEVEDKTGVSKTEVAVVKFNDVETPIYTPTVTVTPSTTLVQDELTRKCNIGSIKVGDTTENLYCASVHAYPEPSLQPKEPDKSDKIYLGNINVGGNVSNFYAPRVESKTTDLLTVNNDTVNKKIDLTIDKDNLLNMIYPVIYPVGSIYMSTVNKNPRDLFNFGLWTPWGHGKVPVGVDSRDDEFKTVEKQGGSKTQTVSGVNSHSHAFTPAGTVTSTFKGDESTTDPMCDLHTHEASTDSQGNHWHTVNVGIVSTKSVSNGQGKADIGSKDVSFITQSSMYSSTDGAHTHKVTIENCKQYHAHNFSSTGTVESTFKGTQSETKSTGSGATVSVLQPYITCYMWKRVE